MPESAPWFYDYPDGSVLHGTRRRPDFTARYNAFVVSPPSPLRRIFSSHDAVRLEASTAPARRRDLSTATPLMATLNVVVLVAEGPLATQPYYKLEPGDAWRC